MRGGQSDRCEKWPAGLWHEWARQAIALCKHKEFEKDGVIGCNGDALAAINMALEEPVMVDAVLADSFEGLSANPDITEQIRIGREFAKQNEDFRRMLEAMHGDDWESVVDADTEAVISHAILQNDEAAIPPWTRCSADNPLRSCHADSIRNDSLFASLE